jgi:CysZ protein
MLEDIINGIKAYFKAIAVIKSLNLWKYFLIPAGIAILLGVILITSAFSLSDNIGVFLIKYWKFDFGKGIIQSISSFIGGISIILLGIVLFKHILMALSAPFMTPVSEIVEQNINCYIRKNKIKPIHQLIRSIKLNFVNLLKELIITLPLLVLSFIPIIGLFFMLLIFYYQAYYAGIGNMDYALERHLDYKQSHSFYKKHKGVAVGNGIVFTLLLFIPFVGIIISLPIATVAATIESIKKLEKFENDIN